VILNATPTSDVIQPTNESKRSSIEQPNGVEVGPSNDENTQTEPITTHTTTNTKDAETVSCSNYSKSLTSTDLKRRKLH
jgi:hypothetical protein